MQLDEQRAAEAAKYHRVYRDYSNYHNRDWRVDLAREWIESHLATATTFLDVGCGRGEVVREAVALKLDARGCDVVPALCEGERFDLITGAHDLPYTDHRFDLVSCCDVLEHIMEPDVDRVLSELRRVSKGRMLLEIGHKRDPPFKYGETHLHITVHPREWWEAKLGDDFSVIFEDRNREHTTWFKC